MKIPTPILIEQLRLPIPRTPWDCKVTNIEAVKIEKLMKEAATQLEWFLKYTTKKGETTINERS